MFSSLTMFQRTLTSKTVSRLSRLIPVSRIRKFSDITSTKNNDNSLNVDESQDRSSINDNESLSSEENVSRLLKEAATYSDAKDTSWATSPYPAGAPTALEEEKIVKPKIDPDDTSTVIFPGQGIIKAGFVKQYLRYPQAKELFELANEVLNYNLLDLCLNGPQEKLNKTRFNQPATVVASLAALEKLREERPKVFDTCVAVAGYSIGELTALIFSGALSFEDGVRLVSVRANGMQYASERSPQGMISVYCTPQAKVIEACNNAKTWAQDIGVPDPVCQIAIYLCTQTKVLAGNAQALEYIEKNGDKYGLRKITRMPVSGAFHTKLMEPALRSFMKMLDAIEIDEPRCQVYSNYKGHVYANSRMIRRFLPKQIVYPVKWEQNIQTMYNRSPGTAFPRSFDVGSGGKMKTILKLINAKAYDNCIVV